MPHGNPIRMPGFDYSSPGWYFVTVVVEGRRHLFGRLQGSHVVHKPLGQLACEMFEESLRTRPWISCRAFIVMPDHVHALIGWETTPGNRRDTRLGHLVSQFKGMTTREARSRGTLRAWERIWQDGFWEVVIRTANQLERCERYIQTNPERSAARRGHIRSG